MTYPPMPPPEGSSDPQQPVTGQPAPGAYPAGGFEGGGFEGGYPPGYAAPQHSLRNGLGTAALVCGITSLIPGAFLYVGFVLGILAIVFGAIGRGRVRRGEANNPKMAIAGLILGILGLVATGVVTAFYVHSFHRVQSCRNTTSTQDQLNQCIRSRL